MNNILYNPNDPYCIVSAEPPHVMPFMEQQTTQKQPSAQQIPNLPRHHALGVVFENIPALLHFLFLDCGSVLLLILLVILFLQFFSIVVFR